MPNIDRISPSVGAAPKSFIFMKVGDHAGETFEQIMARKMAERDAAGMIFWGYGGAACHPISQVQPFLRLKVQEGEPPVLLMHGVRSNADQDQFPAEEYSEDGVNWRKIPKGIRVTGSRFALVLDEIRPVDFNVDVRGYEVGIGPSRGKLADQYLLGRTDKACLTQTAGRVAGIPDERLIKRIDYLAPLQEPYAVMLR